MSIAIRGIVLSLCAIFIAAFAGAATGQAYPAKAVRIVVPYAPGGGSDLVARIIAARFTSSFGQQFIVDNRPGGGASVGFELFAATPADGYSLLVADGSGILGNFSSVSGSGDIAVVGMIATVPYVLVVHPSVPANSVKDLIALLKAQPGKLTYASSGAGGLSHRAAALFGMLAGVQMVHVPYKGGGAAIVGAIAGEVGFMFASIANAVPMIKSGKVRAIAVTSVRRSSALPDIPPLAESGLPGYEAVEWYGMFVPAKTPRDIVAKLGRELSGAVAQPDIRERLMSAGAEPASGTPEQFGAHIRTEFGRWLAVNKSVGTMACQSGSCTCSDGNCRSSCCKSIVMP